MQISRKLASCYNFFDFCCCLLPSLSHTSHSVSHNYFYFQSSAKLVVLLNVFSVWIIQIFLTFFASYNVTVKPAHILIFPLWTPVPVSKTKSPNTFLAKLQSYNIRLRMIWESCTKLHLSPTTQLLIIPTSLTLLIQPQSELDIGSWYVTYLPTLPTTPPRTLRVVVVQAGSLKQFLLSLDIMTCPCPIKWYS